MGDVEMEPGVAPRPEPPVLVGQVYADTGGKGESERSEGRRGSPGHAGVEEPAASPADAALAPPCGEAAACSCEACRWLEARGTETSVQSMQLQFRFFTGKVEELLNCLASEPGRQQGWAVAASVPSFLYTCQLYFNHLESIARTIGPQHAPLPFDIHTKHLQLLDFSQQLCDSLEQLVLAYASCNLLCLDETEPDNVSHFCIGQCRLGQLRMTAFRYCKPTPFLARVDTGLLKRMRWNVERFHDERQVDEEQREAGAADTEYYFLCCEDVPDVHAQDTNANQAAGGGVTRMWSIGRWVQVNPDPDTEDIYGWVTCEAPQADYHKLASLGSEEPSCRHATDQLQRLLLPQRLDE